MTLSTGSLAFAGFRFPREVISVAVRWYLRYGLSYRDVEEPLAERGIAVEHVTVYRWVQRFTAEFFEAARPCRRRRAAGGLSMRRTSRSPTGGPTRSGPWSSMARWLMSCFRHGGSCPAARAFFARALAVGVSPTEVNTDRAHAYPRVLDEQVPAALHVIGQYANNPIEADHSRLKSWLRPMRGLKRFRSAQTLAAGHSFVQNVCRGHYGIAADEPAHERAPHSV